MTLRLPVKRANKFHAVRTEVDGVRFDSKREAGRYVELKYLEKAGEIYDLELQPSFDLHVAPRWNQTTRVLVAIYRADFRYREGPKGVLKVEDVKSPATRTAVYRLKKKMVEAQYGIEITEI